MATPTHQLTLVADERSYDLVVPVGARVTDVLSVLGISSSATPSSVATPGGHVYGPQDRLGEDLTSGTVLTVVRTTTHQLHRDVVSTDRSSSAPGARAGAPASAGGGRAVTARPGTAPAIDDSTRRREDLDPDATITRSMLAAGRPGRRAPRARARQQPVTVPGLLVGIAAVSLVGSLAALGNPAPADAAFLLVPVTLARWVTTGLLLAAAVMATIGPLARLREASVVRLAAAPALAVAAGLTVPLPDSPDRIAVSGVLGCALGAATLALGGVEDRGPTRAARTAMASLGAIALVLAAGVLGGWPSQASAALLLGLVPLVVRALPSASLAVAPEQLVDTDRLSTTVWAVRERHARRRSRVLRPDVRDQVEQARAVVSVGTAYLALTAAGSGWVIALTPPMSSLAPWAGWALGAVAAIALGYQSRAVRDRTARFAMLAACASLTVSSTSAVLTQHPSWVPVVVALTVVIGLASVAGAVAVGGGYRSTRLSRAADRVESLSVVLALPLAVVAAGGVEGLRRMTSG
ncbi:MAG: hypothetical protein ABIQ61_12040 [Ornithinibacter sp.]